MRSRNNRIPRAVAFGILCASALFVAVADTRKPAQKNVRRSAELSSVLARLPLDWRRSVEAYLSLDTDTTRRLLLSPSREDLEGSLLYLLSLEPKAHDFVLAHLTDRLPFRSRLMVLRGMPAQAHWVRNGRVDSVLAAIVVSEPDQELALTALGSVRSLEMRRLRQLLGQRIEAIEVAHHGGELPDDLRKLEQQDERLMLFSKGAMVPGFLRRVPPIFSIGTVGRVVRFLAFGDFGSGDEKQRANAAAMVRYGRKNRFDFGVTLGDNFYDTGMMDPEDPRWRTWWEDLYGPLGITFYPSFGNHDWYGPDSPAAEILYSQHSSTWRMPSPYYSFTAGPAQFFAIDSDDFSAAQLRWLSDELDKSKAEWKIVYGHHPPYIAAASPPWDHDARIVSALMPILKGRADVYIAGHVHDMEHLQPIDGVNLFIAGGGGAPTYQIQPDSRHALFAKQAHGFAVFELDRTTLTVRFVDTNAEEMYHATIRKK
jgi:tartrate-resistant acid phosphatase type 5